jgi:hypothetical protein
MPISFEFAMKRMEPELQALNDRQAIAIDELDRLGRPKTLAGLKAMVTASLAVHDHKDTGSFDVSTDHRQDAGHPNA